MAQLPQYYESFDGNHHVLELDHGLHDAGHEVSYTFWFHDAELTRPGGIFWWHNCPEYRAGPDGTPYPDRPGGATFADESEAVGNGATGPRWGLVSRDPLTLEGSLLCCSCGRHGFIRNGRWEPC